MTTPGSGPRNVLPLVIQAAVAVAALHFPEGTSPDGGRLVTRGMTCFVLDGHLEAWSGWGRLSAEHQRRLTRLLRHRHNQLANAQVAGELLDRLLMAGELPGCTPASDYADTGIIIVTPGMPITDFADACLDEVTALHATRDRCLPAAAPGQYRTTIFVPGPGIASTATDVRFDIREHHVADQQALPAILDAGPLLTLAVPFTELEDIAAALDAASGTAYRTLLGSSVAVTPLMSPRSVLTVAEAAAGRTTPNGPDADWIWSRLGYGCALSAAATADKQVDAWQPGQEPCAALRRPDATRRRHDSVAACPWRGSCGKFALARAACTAGIIVTSHANLLAGRLQALVDDGHGVTDQVTVEELILRRSHVLVIDEIDSFQRTALEQAGRGLLLAQAGRTDTPGLEGMVRKPWHSYTATEIAVPCPGTWDPTALAALTARLSEQPVSWDGRVVYATPLHLAVSADKDHPDYRTAALHEADDEDDETGIIDEDAVDPWAEDADQEDPEAGS